jgi:hypothetical protein
MLAATLPLFVVLYVFNPFFLPHYPVVITPALILFGLLGADTIARAASVPRSQTKLRVAIFALIFATALTSLWEAKWLLAPPGSRPLADGFQERVPQSYVQSRIDELARPPAVVLFGKSPDLWTQMAYNTDVAWPDDAPIIRAHDLGLRDAELIDYYGQLQPERTICQFDWVRGSIRFLGKAGDLRRRLLGAPSSSSPPGPTPSPGPTPPAEPPRTRRKPLQQNAAGSVSRARTTAPATSLVSCVADLRALHARKDGANHSGSAEPVRLYVFQNQGAPL